MLCCVLFVVVRDVATSDRHCTVERRHSIMVCESPQVFPSTHSVTAPQPVDATDNKSHESRGKLRRSAPVSKSRACVNDVRQKRLSLPLHGIHEEDCVEHKTLHDPACGFNSVSEENEVCEEYVFDRSKGLRMPITRSHYQSLQRSATITESVGGTQSMSKSKSSSGVREKPRPMVRARSSVDLKPTVLVRARNVPRSQSSDQVSVRQRDGELSKPESSEDMAARPRPKPAPRKSISKGSPVLARQSAQPETKEESPESSKSAVISESENKTTSKRPSSEVEVKVRRKSSESVSISDLENSGEKVRRSSRHSDRSPSRRSDKSPRRHAAEGSGEDSSSRRHRESSPSSRRHRDSSSSRKHHRESQHGSESPRRHRREGRDESSHSEIVNSEEQSSHRRRHRRSSNEDAPSENKDSDKFLRQSKDRVPLRRSTRVSEDNQSEESNTTDRKSKCDSELSTGRESPKPEVRARRSLQLTNSVEGDNLTDPSTTSPQPVASNEPVQRRSRPQTVSRAQSHRNFYRHSTDFSGSRAVVPEVSLASTTTTPANRGINLGRYRKEAEELLKPIHQEERNPGTLEKLEERSPERPKFSELNVSDLLHVSVGPVFGAASTNGVPTSTSPDSDSAVSINACY